MGAERGQLQPATTYEDAHSYYLAAAFDLALEILDKQPPDDLKTTLLRVSCLMRMGQHPLAYAALLDAEDNGHESAEYYALLAQCNIRLNDISSAYEAIVNGRKLVNEETTGIFSFNEGLTLWADGRYDTALAVLEPLADCGTLLQPAVLQMQAWVRIGQERYGDALCLLQSALAYYKRSSEIDAYMAAKILWPYSLLAREIQDVGATETILSFIDRISWSKWIQTERFHALRNVGWCIAESGNYSGAFRAIRQAEACTPSVPWRVMILCDRAQLYASTGEHGAAAHQIAEARDIASGVQWMATRGEERYALLLLAHLAAPLDLAFAKSLIETYRSLQKTDLLISGSGDARVHAFEQFVFGSIAHVAGDVVTATVCYAEAYDVYQRIGYEWRATLALFARGELLGKKCYLETVAKQLGRFQNSWLKGLLAEKVASYLSTTPIRFTPAQRQVLRELCRGMTDREIAQSIGRSPATVRDHLQTIRRATGTKTRAELVAYCAREGLLLD